MRASSLKGKHVEVLLQRWQAEGLSVGTLKNHPSSYFPMQSSRTRLSN